jgi:hypothetical protein
MIPTFEPSGNLPPGIHSADWAEVVGQLGTNERRRALLGMLRPALAIFKLAGCVSVYLAGSFVSVKPYPGDIDVLWDPADVNTTVLDLIDPLLTDRSAEAHTAQVQRYGAEFIATTEPRLGLTFLEFFQTAKEDDSPKGILRLDLRKFR